MNGYVKTTMKCAAALGLFHLGATLFVRSSNLHLLEKTRAIADAGFLAIPTPAIQPALDSWEAALCGALFFTLTSGAMALFSALVAPALHLAGVLSQKKAVGIHAGLLTSVLLLIGIAPETVPLLLGTIGVYLILMPFKGATAHVRLAPLLFHTLIPIFLALGITGTHQLLPQGLFSGFRDAFLFDNPAGNAVRHFYYTYTLFPAEGFKRLDQKSQVTVCIKGSPGSLLPDRLRRSGQVPVSLEASDYTLTLNGPQLVLTKGKATLAMKATDFRATPGKSFRKFSALADPFGPLRTLTWYALFTAFPLLFYLLFHTTVTLLAGLFSPLSLAARISTLGVAISAVALLTLLASGLSLPKSTQATLDALSGSGVTKGAPTKAIVQAAVHPSALARYRAALAVPRIPSPPLQRELLIRLSRDPDTNVVCQALGAMGNTKDRSYIPMVEEVVRSRTEWYVQWYGYRAMRRLGWHQEKR